MEKKVYWKGVAAGVLGVITIICLTIIITTVTGVMDWRQILPNYQGKVLNAQTEAKLREMQAYIDMYYLDDIDQKQMENAMYGGVVEGLGDDYAAYYDREAYSDLMEKTMGNYCGIGAYVSQNVTTGAVTIIEPIEGSPAQKAGLQFGDIVLQVDGVDVTGKDLSEVVGMMKGEPKTKVKLQIARPGEENYRDVIIERAEIQSETVEYRLLDEKIGYIAVSAFEEVTKQQFRKALNELEKQGQQSLIIDLRNNGGGLLDTAVDMLDRMLPEGMVVYIQDKNGKKDEYHSSGEESFQKPVVILVNENSASASEVFAGAMQDYGKAVLVGEKTFGKGIVQSVFELSDGTAVKLTTSKYYTPKGRNIHGTGLMPDIEAELEEDGKQQAGSGIMIDSQMKKGIEYLQKQQ